MGLDYLQQSTSTTDAASYNFASVNLGTAASDRYIIACVASRVGSGTPTIDAVSIGGVAATPVVTQVNTSSGSNRIGIYIAAVPTGTTGDVDVTFSTTMLRCVVTLYRATAINSATASDTDSSTSSDPTCSLNVPAGGFAIGTACVGSTTGTYTWTGITEDYDAATEAFTMTSASDEFVSEQTGLTLTATYSGLETAPVGVFASWAPSGGGGGGNPLLQIHMQMAG